MVGFFSTLVGNVPAIPAVADYGLLNYPPIRMITRSRNPETCTAPAIVRYSMLCLVLTSLKFNQFNLCSLDFIIKSKYRNIFDA